jgi:hypothetical protein
VIYERVWTRINWGRHSEVEDHSGGGGVIRGQVGGQVAAQVGAQAHV